MCSACRVFGCAVIILIHAANKRYFSASDSYQLKCMDSTVSLSGVDCEEESHTDRLPSSCPVAGKEAAVRTLTTEEEELLKRQDTRIVSDFKQRQLEAEARKHWDLFYKRNSTKFFKDRHWTTREFEELSGASFVSRLRNVH
jgi:hypothetical protein